MSLFDPSASVSKESPSSLLPPPAKRSWFQSTEEPPSEVGPSSLLPDEPSARYPAQAEPELAAVSPSELLSPQPRPDNIHRRLGLVAAASCAVIALVVGVLVFSGEEKSTEQLMQEAVALQSAGKYEAAVIQLKNVLAREPDHVEANLLAGKSYLATGALPDAEKSLKRAQELGATPKEVIPLLAQALIDLDRHEDALKLLSNSIDAGAGAGARSALLRGRAFLGLGNLVEARTQFTIARAETPDEAMFGLARIMMLEGNPEGARRLIDEMTTAFPRSVQGWLAQGELFRGLGEPAQALTAYRKAQSLQSDDLDAALGAATALIAQGDFGEARKEVRKARAISPSNHVVGFVSALLAFSEKRFEDARSLLEGVFSVAPSHMPSILLSGILNLAMGDIEHAHKAFVAYLNHFPGNIQARKLNAIALLRKQQPQAAIENLSPFVDLDIRDPAFFSVAGQAFLQVGEVGKARKMFDKAARLQPNNPLALTDLGIAHIFMGNADEGIEQLQKAVALGPANPRPDRHLALALLARGRIDQAFGVAERLEKRIPGIPDSHWLKGLVFAARNDVPKARESFEAALKVSPSYFPAAAALADIDAKEGKPTLSRVRFEKILQHDPRSWQAALSLAQLDAQEGKLVDAIARMRRAVSEHPGQSSAYLALARLHLQAGNVDDALNAVRRARELDPRDPNAAEVLGQAQFAAGNFNDAVLSFTTLVNIRPRYVVGRIRLSEAQRAANDSRSAIATAQEALTIAPGNPNVIALLGTLLLEGKRYDQALRVAARARDLLPNKALGHEIEGDIRLAQHESNQALTAFKKANDLQPSGELQIKMHRAASALLGRDAPVESLLQWVRKSADDVAVRLYCADVLVRLERAREAVPLYLDVLKQRPGDFRVLNNVADALMRIGDRRALDYAQQAFQSKPDDPVIVTTLGSVLLGNGKLYEAVQILQKATQLDPANPEIRFQFVQALVKVGDRIRAKAELKVLLASGKEFPHSREARILAGTL